MALPDSRLDELCRVASTTGNDPALDALLLRLHMETACRRGGALALTPDDLDPEQCLIRLREKGETIRWQPVSPTLMRHLLAHGESRGGLGNGQRLLRYANGRPITKKRYEYLWRRLGEHLAWVETLQVSMYWIRHTILTWVERNFGFAVAEAYAGHEDNGRGCTLHGRHGHLRPGRPARGGDRPRRPHRRTPPAGHQRPRHRPRERVKREPTTHQSHRLEVWQDVADPDRIVEQFVVASWNEHSRQHERVTRRASGRLGKICGTTDPDQPTVSPIG